jgi:hypothetical protein
MTETKWLSCEDPAQMLTFLRKKATERKLRLFALCCCRSIWRSMKRRRSRAAVEALERYAEGLTDANELATRQAAAYAAFMDEPDKCIEEIIAGIASDAALSDYRAAASSAIQAADVLAHNAIYYDDDVPSTDENQAAYHSRKAAELAAQCRVLRDILGNPFRPVSLDPAWITSDVLALAKGIYDDRAFDRMPILADALQDAGCENDEVLNHCRDSSLTHVRGCWVVDLVLGKE